MHHMMLSSNLDTVSNKILDSVKATGQSVIGLIKGIFDYAIIPLGILAVLAIIFFQILSIAKSKRQRDNAELEEQVKGLIIAIVVLLVVSGYASFAWGLI